MADANDTLIEYRWLIAELARHIERHLLGRGFLGDGFPSSNGWPGYDKPATERAALVGEIIRHAADRAVRHMADEIADGTADVCRSEHWLWQRDQAFDDNKPPPPVVSLDEEIVARLDKLATVPWEQAAPAAQYVVANYQTMREDRKLATYDPIAAWNALRDLTYAAGSLEAALDSLRELKVISWRRPDYNKPRPYPLPWEEDTDGQ